MYTLYICVTVRAIMEREREAREKKETVLSFECTRPTVFIQVAGMRDKLEFFCLLSYIHSSPFLAAFEWENVKQLFDPPPCIIRCKPNSE